MDYNAISEGTEGGNTEAITLWLGTGRDQAQAIKAIINNGFTALQLGYLSSTLELVSDGPQFIVSRGITDIVGDPPFSHA